MSPKDYCSTVCGSRCCRAYGPVVAPSACPRLDRDTGLCKIYPDRLGFVFRAWTREGKVKKATCRKIEDALPDLPEDIRAQCCYLHPELLEQ